MERFSCSTVNNSKIFWLFIDLFYEDISNTNVFFLYIFIIYKILQKQLNIFRHAPHILPSGLEVFELLAGKNFKVESSANCP